MSFGRALGPGGIPKGTEYNDTLKASHPFPVATVVWNDYEKIYEEDQNKEELDAEARVWRVSNDESERIDIELVARWTSTLDTLFIFVITFLV